MTARKSKSPETTPGRWPHRLAWVLACAVFMLICMGSLVATFEAGMAVPDWPTTYGHWFYPPQKWLFRLNDLFLANGHRTAAQVVGLLCIATAVVLWRADPRKWIRWLAVAAVLGVLLQGTLGGLRVIFDERLLARVHGCTAPLFFALCAALVALTSPAWRNAGEARGHAGAATLQRATIIMTSCIYLLIVLGAQLRHPLKGATHGWFPLWVCLALILVGLVMAGVAWLTVLVTRRFPGEKMIVRRASTLAVLLSLQLVLGIATWVTNFGWPAWFTNYVWAIQYTVVAEGRLQVWATTAHTAVGSLNLAVSLSLSLWSLRLLKRKT